MLQFTLGECNAADTGYGCRDHMPRGNPVDLPQAIKIHVVSMILTRGSKAGLEIYHRGLAYLDLSNVGGKLLA